MQKETLFTFRSVTAAMDALRRLERAWIRAELIRPPRALSDRGCAYALRLRGREAEEALMILRREHFSVEKVLRRDEQGRWL